MIQISHLFRFRWFRKNNTTKMPDSLKEAFMITRFNALKENIKEALTFLRTKQFNRFVNHRHLPWYVVIGAQNSGKTTLLASSDLGLVSSNNRPLKRVTSTSYCQWFFGNDAIFIDTSGNLMLPEHMDTLYLNLWEKFIDLLNRYKPSHRLDGLILTIDVWHFQHKSLTQQTQYLDTLKHHIQTFSYPIPLYIIITRCDELPGFSEFFHVLSHEEREQVCGISLPLTDQQNFAEYLETQLNDFLLCINQQMLVYLQREPSLEKRIHIKNFPLQLEAQKEILIHFSNQLHQAKNPVKGIYFTSSQEGTPKNDVLSPLLKTFGFPDRPVTLETPVCANVFFIKKMLKKITTQEQDSISTRRIPHLKIWQNRKFLFCLTGFFIITAALISYSYFYNQRVIRSVETLLADYQDQSWDQSQNNPLALLNTLRKGEDAVDQGSNIFSTLIFHEASGLKSQLHSLYSVALNNTFTPLLEKFISAQIQSEMQQKSPKLYNTLKVYLMINNPTHKDLDFIKHWFELYVQISFQNNDTEKMFFMKHLEAWLNKQSSPFKIDTQLVRSAREALNTFSPTDIVYANLERTYQQFDAQGIPKNLLYTAENFNPVYKKIIPKICTQTLKDNRWVLGEAPSDMLLATLVRQITNDTQALYIARYTDFWSSQILKLSVPTFKNLKEAHVFAQTFMTDRSILLAPLGVIQTNLLPVATTPAGIAAMSTLQTIIDLIKTHGLDKNTNQAIQNFVSYSDHILNARNIDQTTLSATQMRMQKLDDNDPNDPIEQLLHVATNAPTPIDHWIKQLAINTWQTMLSASQYRLNQLWVTQVLNPYHHQIFNRYPIFKESGTEVSLKDFNTFFGYSGIMDTFFKENIAAFVDNKTLYWKWKIVDGLSLGIPQSALEMMNRAGIIQKMFFPNQEKTAHFAVSVTPTDLALLSDHFILHLQGKNIDYVSHFKQAQKVNWPGKQNEASLILQEADKKQILYTEKGDWAFFRLLTHALLKTTDNPKLYTFVFNTDHTNISYDFLVESPINPFIPNILDAFRCPEGL